MSNLITEKELTEAVNSKFTIKEMAHLFGVSVNYIYYFLDKYQLKKKHDENKLINHYLIRDLARSTILQLVLNLLEKVNKPYDNTLKPAEIGILIRIAESDGLLEKLKDDGDTNPIDDLNKILTKMRDEQNIIDKKPKDLNTNV